ncbi:hypothetical protein FOZ60_004029 [Perkinsus olseni]|uniref:Uncharacterized protein n=1 Tax=Perkinsus olseni TaxID=32597 RepID=A0A7J6NUT8_PEROL|nr:hypothetical protein FOZ60_004029 [Perkinsus olseni]
MATILRLLLPLLLAIVGALDVRIRCAGGRQSYHGTLDIQRVFDHYFFVSNPEVMAGARKILKNSCGLNVHEELFLEVYVFDDFMVTNLDDTTYAIAKRSRNVDLDVVRD